jgi:hypothetical protein
VSDNIQSAARSPQLPGAAAKLVAEHFHLFLKTVLFFNIKHLDNKERQDHFALSNTCMSVLIDFWNCINTPMALTDPDLPPSTAVRNS